MCHCCFKANSPLRKRRKSEGRAKDNRTMIEQRTKEYRTHIEETPFFNYNVHNTSCEEESACQRSWRTVFDSSSTKLHKKCDSNKLFLLVFSTYITLRYLAFYPQLTMFLGFITKVILFIKWRFLTFAQFAQMRSLAQKYAITDYQQVIILVIICACLRICANSAKVGSHLNTYFMKKNDFFTTTKTLFYQVVRKGHLFTNTGNITQEPESNIN